MNHGLQKFRLDASVVILFSICSKKKQKHTLIFTLTDDEVDEFYFTSTFYLLNTLWLICVKKQQRITPVFLALKKKYLFE